MKKFIGLLVFAFLAMLLTQPVMAAKESTKAVVVCASDLPDLGLVAQADVAQADVVQAATESPVVSDVVPTTTTDEPFSMAKFIASYWLELLVALMAFIKVIVRLTPTLKDDSVFGYLDKLIEFFIPNLQTKK